MIPNLIIVDLLLLFKLLNDFFEHFILFFSFLQLKRYIVDLVFATREPDQVQGPLGSKLASLKPLLRSGASPRATIALNLAARAHAFLNHRAFVVPDDVKAIGLDVLRHRVPLTFEAEAEEVKPDDVVRRIFEGVPVP